MRTDAPTDDLPAGILAAFIAYRRQHGGAGPCALVIGPSDGLLSGFKPGLWERHGNGGAWAWSRSHTFPGGESDFLVPTNSP